MNLGDAPEWIYVGQFVNQCPIVRIQCWSPLFAGLGLPTPVTLESFLMLPYDGIRLHNQEGGPPS